MIKMTVTSVIMAIFFLTGVAVAEDTPKLPDLVGKWTSGSQVHFKDSGYINNKDKVGELIISSQKENLFTGEVKWSHSKSKGNDTFSGVIEDDGKTFYIVGHKEGIRICKLTGPDSFTMYILIPGGAQPRAGMSKFTREKK
jgi:hypothetical protein